MIERQEISETFRVAVILSHGVLKAALFPKYHLRPVRVGLASKYPTAHVFRFNDEYSKARDQNVIDLRGAIAIRQDDVVNGPVHFSV